MSEAQLIDAVRAERIHGFLLCDFECPTAMRQTPRAKDLPYMWHHTERGRRHVGPVSAKLARRAKRLDPSVRTLAPTHTVHRQLISTVYACYLLDAGMRVSNVERCIQYQACDFLTKTINKLIEIRRQAKRDKNKCMDLTVKLGTFCVLSNVKTKQLCAQC